MIALVGAFAACVAGVYGAPATSSSTAAATSITAQSQLASILSGFSPANSGAASSYASVMTNIQPLPTPSNTADFASKLSSVYAANPSSPLKVAPEILLNGLAGPNDFNDLNGYGACNSYANVNLRQPSRVIYPKASPSDAPYDISESQLRAAIYFPSAFTYGKKKPVLMLPGTGVYACETYYSNAYKLLSQTSYADPVFINIPDALLDDVQTNAEYVAYAINYVSAITNRNVSLLTWSAGSITAHWAFKYWPSTRNNTSESTNISGDYHGTQFAQLICPPGTPCAPAVLQQFYNSRFVQTLRANGGDSAYVPNTSCWSIYDEIVEPQQSPDASAMLNDARNVGTLNAQIQTVCGPATPASGPNFGHEASLYNAVCYALLNDAIKNGGPADLARSGAVAQCSNFEAPGLDLADIFATESTIPIAGFGIETYPNKVLVEPAIKAYAQKDAPA